jgi:hypothetical protein
MIILGYIFRLSLCYGTLVFVACEEDKALEIMSYMERFINTNKLVNINQIVG